MSKRDTRLFLYEMVQAITKVSSYLEGIEKPDFEANTLVQDAVIRNLEIMGEAARQIPTDLAKRYPDVPWKRIIGFRNIAIHAYFDVDLGIVWRISTEDLPRLRDQMKRMLDDLGGMPPLER